MEKEQEEDLKKKKEQEYQDYLDREAKKKGSS